ncbi:MAG: Arm DNA-binding domain-containing protein [Pseudomonadota bacterium]
MPIHLTGVSVKALKASPKSVTYFSDQTPGFGIRVGKRSRTWIVMRGRSRERIRIGAYPQISLTDARKKAMQLLGTDKAPPKPKTKSFREARTQFLDEFFRGKSVGWQRNVTTYLAVCFKKLDHHKLDEIEDHEIKACLDAVHETPSQQLHAFAACAASCAGACDRRSVSSSIRRWKAIRRRARTGRGPAFSPIRS